MKQFFFPWYKYNSFLKVAVNWEMYGNGGRHSITWVGLARRRLTFHTKKIVCTSLILNIRISEFVVGLPISVITVTICDADGG